MAGSFEHKFQMLNYDMWKGNSPQVILNALKKHYGGKWAQMFRFGVPEEIHRVRNFFNVTPTSLKLIRGSDRAAIKTINKYSKTKHVVAPALVGYLTLPALGLWGAAAGVFANKDKALSSISLTDHVYKDSKTGKHWWQMSPGGVIYHIGTGHVKYPKWEAIVATAKGQEDLPFKLISLDENTGGSHEVIILNPHKTETIGKGMSVTITPKLLETDPHLQGSYNYSETSIMGLPSHEKMDVDTHKRFKGKSYVNPTNPNLSLSSRKFPARDDKAILIKTLRYSGPRTRIL